MAKIRTLKGVLTMAVDHGAWGVHLHFRDLVEGQTKYGGFGVAVDMAAAEAIAAESGRAFKDIGGTGLMAEVTGVWARMPNPYKANRDMWFFKPTGFVVLPPPVVPQVEADFRAFVVKSVLRAVELSDCHKSSEGALTMGWSFPNVFDDDPTPRYKIDLYAYVMGPARTYEWVAFSREEAIAAATRDINGWIAEIEADEAEDADAYGEDA